MAYYRQNEANGAPFNGTAPTRNHYPRSAPIYQPGMIPESMTNAGTTNPSDGFRARPGYSARSPVFGFHDALRGRLMAVAQADSYDSSHNAFPASGVFDEPGAWPGVMQLIRLQPTSSAHPGLQLATGAGPTMLFHAPPVFSQQTTPIYATGL